MPTTKTACPCGRTRGIHSAPWSLHFDRDGTEDYGVICDRDKQCSNHADRGADLFLSGAS